MITVFFVIYLKDGIPQETRIYENNESKADTAIYNFYLAKYGLKTTLSPIRESVQVIDDDTMKYGNGNWEVKKVVKETNIRRKA